MNPCPNLPNCQLVHPSTRHIPDEIKLDYQAMYCKSSNEHWTTCKRYLVHSQLHFCPEFVLPDSEMTVDEIINIFDEETEQQ